MMPNTMIDRHNSTDGGAQPIVASARAPFLITGDLRLFIECNFTQGTMIKMWENITLLW